MKFKFAIFFSAIFPFIAFAQGGLVPCGWAGKPCTISCFYVLLNNIMNFLLNNISLPLAATAFMVAGIMLVAGGSENAIKRGKSILTSTVIGLLIAFGAWVIINTILGNLLQAPYTPWNKFPSDKCTANPVSPSSSLTPSPTLTPTPSPAPTPTPTPTPSNSYSFDTGLYLDGVDMDTDGNGVVNSNDASQILETQNVGLLQQPPALPSSVYNSKINDYVTAGTNLNGVDPNRVKAIIQAESSGNPNAATNDADGKSSYGLMQVRADTARIYDPSVRNLTDAQIGDKLLNDPQYNINIGTKYYSDLSNKYGDPTLASAAYNGGPVANKPSVDCPGSLRWQCTWDNTAQTISNKGYAPTRTYVKNINTVYSALIKTP